jgi:hypothetical protein
VFNGFYTIKEKVVGVFVRFRAPLQQDVSKTTASILTIPTPIRKTAKSNRRNTIDI